MVDAIGPTGPIQGISSVKSQKTDGKQDAETKSVQPSDEVVISEEALSLSQAETTAQSISESLSQDDSVTLSSDRDRLNALL